MKAPQDCIYHLEKCAKKKKGELEIVEEFMHNKKEKKKQHNESMFG